MQKQTRFHRGQSYRERAQQVAPAESRDAKYFVVRGWLADACPGDQQVEHEAPCRHSANLHFFE